MLLFAVETIQAGRANLVSGGVFNFDSPTRSVLPNMCQVAFGHVCSLKHECCYMQAQKRVEKLCFFSQR